VRNWTDISTVDSFSMLDHSVRFSHLPSRSRNAPFYYVDNLVVVYLSNLEGNELLDFYKSS
jgi:hypothetical protein